MFNLWRNFNMKKTLIAAAALVATGAFAQSAVTLSGSLNAGYKVAANGATSLAALKGDRNNLTFGVVEDMGGGMKVSGTLQFRFDPYTGGNTYQNTVSGSKNDNLMEQAKLAISGGFGEIAAGRFTNNLGTAPIHFMEDSGYAASSTSIYGRVSGQVQYTTPKIMGAQLWVLHGSKAQNVYPTAAGNGLAATTALTDDLNIIGINYTNGPLFVQLADIRGQVGEKSSKWGATYDFGKFKVSVGQYNQRDDIGTGTTGMLTHTSTEFGIQAPFGNWLTALTYQNNDKQLNTNDTGIMNKLGGKAYYSLSKRSTLEFEASQLNNSQTSVNGTAYYMGARHTF